MFDYSFKLLSDLIIFVEKIESPMTLKSFKIFYY